MNVNGEPLGDPRWGELRFYWKSLEADFAVNVLEGQGIPAYRLGDASEVYWRGRGGAKVYVRECDRDRAERILAEMESEAGVSEEELSAEAEAAGGDPDDI